MDIDKIVRQQERPELPSMAMQEKFEFWEEKYTLETFTDMDTSQIKCKRQQFETEVQVLLAKHRPGRIVANRPTLAYLYDKPPYKAQEWKRAREMIRNEAQKVRLRFKQAEGIIAKEETAARRSWITKLVQTLPSPKISINL